MTCASATGVTTTMIRQHNDVALPSEVQSMIDDVSRLR